MPSRPEKPRPTRRDAILSAAAEVFRDKGYQRATTLDIARAAGISKRDLYATFASKDALLEAMIRQGVAEMTIPVTLEPATTRQGFYGALHELGVSVLRFLVSPGVLALYRMAIAEASTSPSIGKMLIEAGAGATQVAVETFVTAAMQRRLVAFPRPDAAIGVFFHVLLGDLRLTALLDPTSETKPATIRSHADLAVLALQRMETG